MRLGPLDAKIAQEARLWRNEDLSALRTSRPLTAEQQAAWYARVSVDPCERWWTLLEGGLVVGYGGLEHIQWEARIAEISLLIAPGCRSKGHGTAAVDAILCEAFDTLNLHNVYGEVYDCNEAGRYFWNSVIERYGADYTMLPDRKFWKGRMWNSVYFSISMWHYRGRDER